MSRKIPTVSIVIPAYNEEAVIRQCVESAIHQTVPAYEIIVVNNRSKDATPNIVRKLQREYPHAHIRLLNETDKQGITPTRNHGFNAVKADIIGRIDADSLLEPDWVEAVGEAFRDPEIAAATGPVAYHDMPLRKFGLQGDARIRKVISTLQGDYVFLFGTNMAIRREVWEEIKDETCHKRTSREFKDIDDEMFEDVDLSIHVAEHGYRTKYVSTMVANMSARRLRDSPKDFLRYIMRYQRTYEAHNLRNLSLKVPIVVYLAIYFPGKAVQKLYDRSEASRGESLTMAELEALAED